MTAVLTPPAFQPPRHFDNAAEWLRALGSVPLERIIFYPWPGTATEADLLRLVERDKCLCELVDGTLVAKPPGFWESLIAAQVIAQLARHADMRDLGAVGAPNTTLRMKSGKVFLPDVSFIAKDRLPTTRDPIPTLAPDLAVEVLSETNTTPEMAQKLIEYFQSGTRLAWYVNPITRTVAIYHAPGEPTHVLNESDTLDGEQVLPGLHINIADLFRNVPPTSP